MRSVNNLTRIPEFIHHCLDQKCRDRADGENGEELNGPEVFITRDPEKCGGGQHEQNGQYRNAFLCHCVFCSLNIGNCKFKQ